MFQHTLVLIYRNYKRFSSTFFINLIGLSAGLACGLLIYLWVNDETSIDKFHEKDDQLFQAMLNHQNSNGIETVQATPGPLAEALLAEMPEVEMALKTTVGWELPLLTLSVGDKSLKSTGLFAGKNYFNMFSYELMKGDNQLVLRDKNSIVLSEGLAMKLFSTTNNIVGKTVLFQFINQQPFVVSGIYKDMPLNASNRFDFVAPFGVLEDMNPGLKEWGNTGPRTFVLLKKGADLKRFNAKVAGLIVAKNENSNASLFFRPYSDKYLYDKYENGIQVGGRIEYVKLFSIIAIFVIIVACINFMNLSTAKASRRVKEVGIKKAIGAARETLVLQYLGESILMAFISLITAVILVLLLLPSFNRITGKELSLGFDANLILSALAITIFTGIIAGSYPALYLSGFNPVAVLKGKLNASVGEVWSRKGLVIFQFTISVILIVAVTVVYKQIEYVQSKNLGYNKENVIYFEVEGGVGKLIENFLQEVKRVRGIANASSASHSFIGQQSWTPGLSWEGKSPKEKIQFEFAKVSYDLIETLGIQMADGRAFSRNYSSDSSKIIFNEAAVAAMGLKEPVGKEINLWGRNRQIIGVAKNFHFESLHQTIKPLFFLLDSKDLNRVYVRVEEGEQGTALKNLQSFYEKYNPGFVFNYKFLDQDYQALYASEKQVSELSQYFAGLTILISCLGLFGLASFTAQRRLKEIAIRKVHGASQFAIVVLLTADFTKMIITAIFIAVPISYFLTRNWLNNFNYKIPLEWWYFLSAGLAALLIGWLTVGITTVKASQVRPINALKDV